MSKRSKPLERTAEYAAEAAHFAVPRPRPLLAHVLADEVLVELDCGPSARNCPLHLVRPQNGSISVKKVLTTCRRCFEPLVLRSAWRGRPS